MPPAEKPGFRFPSAFTILFALIFLVAALTWIIPAGQYARVPSETLGKDVPVAGSYAATDADPQGIFDVLLAPIAGFYDPVAYTANAIDVSLFVVIMGGFIGVVTATGAIDAGYDALVAVAVILLGAGVGVLGSTINAFSTVIASDAAGVSFAEGLWLRIGILVVSWAVTVAFVMR